MRITFYKSNGKTIEFVKFNPYHDRLGRFTSANTAASMTIRTRDGAKQRLADKAAEKEKQRAAQKMKTVDDFTANMSPITRAAAQKSLNKKRIYPLGNGKVKTMTDAEYVEDAVKNGKKIEARKEPKPDIVSYRRERLPEQFAFLKREEGARESQYGDFVRGKYDSPIAHYFRTGDASKLPSSRVKTSYLLWERDGTFKELTKTAFQYAQFLKT